MWFIGLVIGIIILIIINYILFTPVAIKNSDGTYKYVFYHESDFTAQKSRYGDYNMGRHILQSELFTCWGVNFKDAQERISKEYETIFPTHPRPIVLRRVLESPPRLLDLIGMNIMIIFVGVIIIGIIYLIGMLF